MNRLVIAFFLAFSCVASSCSKIEVDEERINLVEIDQWCKVRKKSRSFTVQLTGEAIYSFAESNGVKDCLFFQFDAKDIETDVYGPYLFIVRIDNKNTPFSQGESPTMRTLRKTPAEIVLFDSFYGGLDNVFVQIDVVQNCTLNHVRDGIVAVSIEEGCTYFFKVDKFVTKDVVRWGYESPNHIKW